MKNGEQSIHIITDTINNEYVSGGLTKREYFAAMAMQGLLASNSRIRVCETAILYADELLKQLEK